MTTDFNWIRPNIYSRSEDKNLDFNIQFKPYRWFTRYSFDRAVRLTTKKIKYKFHTIFLLLKGDLDSELILKSFIQYKLKFKVLIIKTSGNKEDSEIAMNLCKEVGIIPVIIELNDIDYLKITKTNKKKHHFFLFGEGFFTPLSNFSGFLFPTTSIFSSSSFQRALV